MTGLCPCCGRMIALIGGRLAAHWNLAAPVCCTSSGKRPWKPPAAVAHCPQCGAELQDEAFTFWCPACQGAVTYAQALSSDYGANDD